jgi:hypothetical protein
MKTCAYCGAENSDDASLCISCGQNQFKSAAVVPKPDPEPAVDSWVTLTKCQSMVEADAIVCRLEGAGIHATIPDEFLMQAVAWNFNTFGFIRVQVLSGDLEKAQQLLSPPPDNQTEPPRAVEDKAETGAEWAKIRLAWPLRFLAFFLPLFLCGGIVVLAIAKSGYERQGFKRKADEFTGFFAVGFLFWVVVITVLGVTYSN